MFEGTCPTAQRCFETIHRRYGGEAYIMQGDHPVERNIILMPSY